MARSKTTFTSANNPRKKATPLVAGSSQDIEAILAEKPVHLPAPRPHTTVRSMTPAPVEQEAPRILPAAEALALAEREGELAGAELKDIEQEQRELNASIAEAQRELQERWQAARRKKDTAFARQQDAKRRISAANAAKDAAAVVLQTREREEAERKAMEQRHNAFAEKLKKSLLPVKEEKTKLLVLREEWGQPLAEISPKVYSTLPTTWPHELRLKVEGAATLAHTILRDLVSASKQMDRVLANGARLILLGPPENADQRTALAELEKDISYCKDHSVDLKRRIDSCIDHWTATMAEAKDYGTRGTPAPVPTAQDQQDVMRESERAALVKSNQRHPDQNKTVRDGAHRPERAPEQTHAERGELP